MNRSLILLLLTTCFLVCACWQQVIVSAQSLSTGQFGHLVSNAQLVREINDDQYSTFKAQLYPSVDSTMKVVKLMRKYPKKNSFTSSVQGRILTKALPVPKQYDLRQLFPECVGDVQNEGQCGSVWAMVSLVSYQIIILNF